MHGMEGDRQREARRLGWTDRLRKKHGRSHNLLSAIVQMVDMWRECILQTDSQLCRCRF